MILENFFLYLGQRAQKFFPKLDRQLRTAGMEADSDYYLADCMNKASKLTIPTSLAIFFIASNLGRSLYIYLTFPSVILIFLLSFVTFASIPKIRTNKRTRELEKDLPYALRDILIQIESGIPLYEAMLSTTEGYGKMSEEINTIIKDVDGGKSMIQALEESIVRNPSEKYRRSMWQLTNSMRSGTDIARTMDSIVESIIKEQKLEIQKYGEELNPFILVYLLVAVIGPALGITGIIVISSFTGSSIGIRVYLIILFLLVVVQIFFLNLIRSKRPEVRA